MYNICHDTRNFEMLFDLHGYKRFKMHNICHVPRNFWMHKMIIEKKSYIFNYNYRLGIMHIYMSWQ
jgi:hypothetical protein